MPPKKQLSEEQIADLTQWIKDGAAWPRVRVPPSLGKPDPEYDRAPQGALGLAAAAPAEGRRR